MKKVTNILLLLLLCFPVYSQNSSKTEQKSNMIEIHFDQNSHVINLDLQQNRETLSRFSDLIEKLKSDTLSVISKIEINSYASPEGGRAYNAKLSKNRSNAISDYLTNTLSIPENLIDKHYSGTDWARLQELVDASDMQYKDEIIYILKNVPEETWERVNPDDKWLSLVDSRNKQLMELKSGNPYRYLFSNIYPQLRNGSIVTIYFKSEIPPVIEPKEEVAAAEEVKPEPEPKPEPVAEAAAEPEDEIRPLFAIKTNLLYDAITALNVELEVPIGQRWSVAAEWIFPWWSSSWGQSSNRNYFQLLNGNVEGKYWFGDRSDRPVMTGWHLGLYAGGGVYDFEHNKVGYQDKFFMVAGLSGGYAHTINKSGNLRMEYSAAVGYLKTSYDKYAEHWGIDDSWHTIRQESGDYSWIGPTRAKVSLVWMLNRKANKAK